MASMLVSRSKSACDPNLHRVIRIYTREKRAIVKNLDDYMSPPYEIKLQRSEDGGGIMLSISLLVESAERRGTGKTRRSKIFWKSGSTAVRYRRNMIAVLMRELSQLERRT